jgi:hypothetical protein
VKLPRLLYTVPVGQTSRAAITPQFNRRNCQLSVCFPEFCDFVSDDKPRHCLDGQVLGRIRIEPKSSTTTNLKREYLRRRHGRRTAQAARAAHGRPVHGHGLIQQNRQPHTNISHRLPLLSRRNLSTRPFHKHKAGSGALPKSPPREPQNRIRWPLPSRKAEIWVRIRLHARHAEIHRRMQPAHRPSTAAAREDSGRDPTDEQPPQIDLRPYKDDQHRPAGGRVPRRNRQRQPVMHRISQSPHCQVGQGTSRARSEVSIGHEWSQWPSKVASLRHVWGILVKVGQRSTFSRSFLWKNAPRIRADEEDFRDPTKGTQG